jgi:translation initiation factor 2B subunit (eIF-2B alpha/beta/delta family)
LLQNSIIRKFSFPHFREGMTLLLHSYSSCVLDVLEHLSERGMKIKVITTESQPTNTGVLVLEKCKNLGLDCQIIYDSALAVSMPEVDCICLGCEAVLANGGIIN